MITGMDRNTLGAVNMYKSVLLTGKEISILEGVLTSFLASKTAQDQRNLTIILNRLLAAKAQN